MDRGDNDSDVAESGRVQGVAVVLERDGDDRRQDAVVGVEDTAMAAGTGDAGCVRVVARMDVVHSGPSPGDYRHRGRRNCLLLEEATTEDQAVSGSTNPTAESVQEEEDNPAGNYHDCQNYAGDHDQGNDYADAAN